MADAIEVNIVQPETGAEAPVVLSSTPRPANVPEQFWDPVKGETKMDELLASIVDKPADAPADEAPKGNEEAPKEGDEEAPKVEDEQADELAEAAGIDIAAVEATFLESGEIGEDTYEKAAKIGISKEMVDEFVQYRVTQADLMRDEMLKPYGGLEAVTGMTEWAGKNWTPEQANAFNEAVGSGDKGRVELAVRALKADFDKKNGVKPKLLTPAGGSSNAGGVFNSLQEMMAAQQDPRYAKDPAYRAEVAAKLRRSKI